MNFTELVEIVGGEPVFSSAWLLAGDVNPADIQRQLSRWKSSGKIILLRRGLYTLAPPYQKIVPHPFLIANRLVSASYISRQSALAYYGMIPEFVPQTTSVTTARPSLLDTPVGSFDFRHIQPDYFFGFRLADLSSGQQAFLASPEKALLDLIYLTPGGDAPAFLHELRLNNLDRLDMAALDHAAHRLARPKIDRALGVIHQLAREAGEYTAV
jgi:predicted transcriptional regulator of viral defense system